MSKIYSDLFLGSVVSSRDEQLFKKHCIKNVLVAAKGLTCVFENRGVNYLQLPIGDNPTTVILRYWPECVAFLEQSAGCTLVHCQGGKSRSASTVMAYVMFKEDLSPEESVVQVRHLHKFAYPNPGFLKQLEYWQEVLTEYRTTVQRGDQYKQDFELLRNITKKVLERVMKHIINPSQVNLRIAQQKMLGFKAKDFADEILEEREEKVRKKEEEINKVDVGHEELKKYLQQTEEEEEECKADENFKGEVE